MHLEENEAMTCDAMRCDGMWCGVLWCGGDGGAGRVDGLTRRLMVVRGVLMVVVW